MEINDKNVRTAIILCGGRGLRLGSISKKFPKSLVKVQGKPILWYIIKILKKNNFNHLILPLGYKGNLIKNYLKKKNFFNLKIDLVDTGVNSNIGKRIKIVEKKILSENLLILNGDAIFDFELDKIFKNHVKKNSGATFLNAESVYQFGTVCIKNNKVVDFNRNIVFESVNVKNKKNIIAFNYAGLLIVNKNILIKHSKIYRNSINFEKKLYPLLIRKYPSRLVKINGFFHSIDNMKDIMIANKKNLKNFFKFK